MNDESPIETIFSGRIMLFRLLQLANAASPIVDKLSGKVISQRLVHP